MSSYTVSIDGNKSTLRCKLFPALTLSKDKQWEAALLDFTTYNSIPNVTRDENNQLHYFKEYNEESKIYSSPGTITLQTGSYEIEDLNKIMQEELGRSNILLQANNNLLKAEIKSSFYLDFTKPYSIGSLLGFPKETPILNPNILHTGTETVNIVKVNTINITCNIVQGSYKDGVNKHILHTFYPTVPPGFKIIDKPHNLVYLPLNSTYISDIELNVLDQDGNFVDFRRETISVRLHIKSQ